MNKSQRIYIGTGDTFNDNFIITQLEQEVNTLEFLSMSIDTKDVYRDFNSDYGVLIGRVIANGGVGIPNAKISIFIPLSTDDASDSVISSLYPYNSPTDKNNDGKRYNLLPRVAQTELLTGEIKPKQPFGSFPIKPELVSNESFLNVYKKYYKYTALTNSAGDYMIFGVPVGTQTVHMSVDITDIGKYSMTPASMIIAGYPANLFIGNGQSIKPSTDLSDLPNIETQEISVDIIPFWGDSTNFTIGITRQDFRIRAVLQASFTIFGTSMTMGTDAVFGDPDLSQNDKALYSISTVQENNIDIRVNRPTPIDFKIFTYGTDVNMTEVDTFLASGGVLPVNPDVDIRELDPSEYFLFNENGNFLLTVPCNRNKVITDELGNEIPVSDNNTFGVFTKFYGMALVRYDDNASTIPITKTFSDKYKDNHPGHTARCSWFKIPQSTPFEFEADVNNPTINSSKWRLKYNTFIGGQVYSVAQLFPVRNTRGINDLSQIELSSTFNNTINYLSSAELSANRFNMGGALVKVGGTDGITQDKFDEQNYLGTPPSDTQPLYRYDFSPNATFVAGAITNYYFGGQWLNFCLLFPQFTYNVTASVESDRVMGVADVFTQYFIAPFSNDFRADNQQKLFGGIKNSKFLFRGDAFSTDFVNITKNDLTKLSKIPLKGLNIRKWNMSGDGNISGNQGIVVSPKGLKYLKPATVTTGPSNFNQYGWDTFFSTYSGIPVGEPATAYIFKGIYDNDCIQMLADFNII